MQDSGVIKKVGNCIMHEVGMEFSAPVEFNEWERRGNELFTVIKLYHSHMAWWLGDWIIFGEKNYKDKYSQALDGKMYTIGTLRNCVWVCRNVPMRNRNPNLSFQHHYEIASLPEGDQLEWLAKAELNNWTSKELRYAIRGLKKPKEEITDRPDDIVANAINHTREGASFDEWWIQEGDKIDVLSMREACFAAWNSALISKAKVVADV